MTTDQWNLSGHVDLKFLLLVGGLDSPSGKRFAVRKKKLPCAVYVYINPKHCGKLREILDQSKRKEGSGRLFTSMAGYKLVLSSHKGFLLGQRIDGGRVFFFPLCNLKSLG